MINSVVLSILVSSLPVLSFDEQVAAADLVILAKAEESYDESGKQKEQLVFTTMSVENVLKGKIEPRKQIDVLTYVNISGIEYNCCERGTTYLLILKKFRSNFAPLIDKSSIYKIK